MGRKGGGRAAFMKKAQRPGHSDDEESSDGADMRPQPATIRDDTPSQVGLDGDAAGDAVGEGAGDAAGERAVKDETKGQMTQRHKREMKAVKDQVKRLGKKGKEEGAKLLKELEERHEREVKALEKREGDDEDAVQEMASLSFYSNTNTGEAKKSKAQKRREKQEQEELDRERRIAEELEAMGDTDKDLEEAALLSKLHQLGLSMKEIPSDGHCLYRAIEDQIKSLRDGGSVVVSRAGGQPLTYTALRKLCAEHLLSNQDDFIHFVEVADGDGFKAYCAEVQNTAAWGGHVELQALSRALSLHIKVHSADGDCVDVGPEHEDTINVCYLRHSCALGEHYNSCTEEDV